MWKKIIIAIIAIIAIAVAYWLISPLFITKKVDEKLQDIVSPAFQENATGQSDSGLTIVSEGKFVGLANHNAQGTASLYKSKGKYFVRFEDDFSSTNGPDVHVYLGKNDKYDPNTELGAIKGNVGSQNYEIPDSIKVSDYDEVWIWCRAFSVPFGKAELR